MSIFKPKEKNRSGIVRAYENYNKQESIVKPIKAEPPVIAKPLIRTEPPVTYRPSVMATSPKHSDFIVIDFETANSDLASACSIGIAAVKGLEIVSEYYSLIKPPMARFDEANIKIHGISYEDVKDSDTFDIIWGSIKLYFSDNLVVAHNAYFDMSVLKNCLDFYDIPHPEFIYLDSMAISKQVAGQDCGTSLENRSRFFNINNSDHHNALNDAKVAAQITICSLKALDLKSLPWYAIMNDLSAKEFSKLIPQKNFYGKKTRTPAVKISDIECSKEDINTDSPFYNKVCVLTGELDSFGRRDAMQEIVDAGGIMKSGVSKKVHYLIVGKQDNTIVGDDGLSNKEEKAYDLINQGVDIQIIYEEEFILLLDSSEV